MLFAGCSSTLERTQGFASQSIRWDDGVVLDLDILNSFESVSEAGETVEVYGTPFRFRIQVANVPVTDSVTLVGVRLYRLDASTVSDLGWTSILLQEASTSPRTFFAVSDSLDLDLGPFVLRGELRIGGEDARPFLLPVVPEASARRTSDILRRLEGV